MAHVEFINFGSVATVLTDEDLAPSFFVAETVLDTVDFPQMGLKGAPLGKALVTLVTLVGTDS